MAKQKTMTAGPAGGLRGGRRGGRGWEWSRRGGLRSTPVRCQRGEWYVARGHLHPGHGPDGRSVQAQYIAADEIIGRRCVALDPIDARATDEVMGWLKTPDDATHMRLVFDEPTAAAAFRSMELHPIAERDPKSHSLANVPRWSTYAPPFTLERVVLPRRLACLAERLLGCDVAVIDMPRSAAALAKRARGAVCMLDAEWIDRLELSLGEVERVAAHSWLIVDLASLAQLVTRSGIKAHTRTHASEHEIMSARVEYADVPTRGFALQDVFPYGVTTPTGGFSTRVLVNSRNWRRYADDVGFAPLLASETPYVDHCGDLLLAARPVDQGELLATDLPWLLAEAGDRLSTPRLAGHLLRMLCGVPLADGLQYWNRWDEDAVLLRDIADLPRRYDLLSTVRWASPDRVEAHLGLTLAAPGFDPPRRHLVIQTGRLDQLDDHDGLPPEPMIILMKHLNRELRERTAWARQHLSGVRVTWQFDTRDGLRHVVNYDSATQVMNGAAPHAVRLRRRPATHELPPADADVTQVLVNAEPGLFGDGSFDYQRALMALVAKRLRQLRV